MDERAHADELAAPGTTGPRPDNDFAPFPRSALDGSITARFEEQVRRHGERLAVASSADAWTYAELDGRANAIAARILAARGPRAEPAAILLEQGAPLLAAIIGALKAGKIYVPLDPASPRARLAALIEDSAAALVLASPATAAAAPPGALVLEPGGDAAADGPPRVAVAPDAGAYIYYTSGSTGRPKGVLDLHRNVLHNVLRYTNTLRVCRDDRLTLLQAPGFSGAVSSMFAALLNGAAVFPFDVAREGADRIAPWLGRERITIYHSVPALFRIAAASGGPFPALRLIRLEGDRATSADVELFRSRFRAPCILVNGLGATECGLVRQHFMGPETPVRDGPVPIGYPVIDMDVVVLGESGTAAAAGEVGEIAVRSRYLAAGYWRRPDLTAAAFTADPSDPERRVYRTGDLGRLGPDGCLEHLGRVNAEVKVRGNRVEPAEVEAALLSAGAVREAAVVTRDDGPEPRLIAYIVPRGEEAPTVGELRRRLADHLPDYMIPSVFVPMPALPLNDNGKVDRRSLPAPDGRRPLLDGPLVRPRNLLQTQLAAIWEETLGVRPVGASDSFLDLGGSSLLAMRMMDRVEEALGRPLPRSVLLAGAAIDHLAEAIQAAAVEVQAPVVPVQAGGSRVPLFFLHGDYLSGGLFCASLARHLGPEQPFYAVPPWGLDGSPVPMSYRAMARRHVRAIRAVRPRGPYRLAGLCNGGLIAFEVARRLEALGERVEFLSPVAAAPPRPIMSRRRRLRRAAGRVSDRVRAAWRAMAVAGRPGPELAPETAEARRARLRETYLQLEAEFVPGRYRGRLTLIWPSEDPTSARSAAASWEGLAPRIDVHVVPGTHISCLTDHARAAAQLMARCLGELDAKPVAAR